MTKRNIHVQVVTSNFWCWHNAEVSQCPLSRRCQGHSGHLADGVFGRNNCYQLDYVCRSSAITYARCPLPTASCVMNARARAADPPGPPKRIDPDSQSVRIPALPVSTAKLLSVDTVALGSVTSETVRNCVFISDGVRSTVT